MSYVVGYAFFFDRVVVFSPVKDAVSTLLSWTSSKGRRRFSGEYLGTVKGVIPVDPYHILYHVHHSTDAFKRRQKEKLWFRRRGMSRRHIKQELKQKRQLSLRRERGSN